MTDSVTLGPKPTTVTGGCLCGKLRYTATLPSTHDFVTNAMTCQCTQCRKQSGALFVAFHRVPMLQWTTSDTSTLAEYGASESAKRGFCSACGSWLYHRVIGIEGVSLCVGSMDLEVLVGEKGADGQSGEGKGFGRALVNGLGGHEFCENEIPGVTDDIPLLNRGQRHQQGM
ncbi:glutathione-dependent formaldehyde-activating enzyme [Colletotrichum truncatum]|uniref:Glutathione-dependent formaldehyde-activating enzyme n=1 Tax=Colletotrichum truncatum TaxID=5467 RepID=A0ACC3YVX4_COLTU|nr:glutathione-dependent formaldehyde-activating enzyme [Colletotrichum truncatum]KAF6791241.1 glutathione-dependent formaldehyde-activating enzyme [Colletotrichum truncatum]